MGLDIGLQNTIIVKVVVWFPPRAIARISMILLVQKIFLEVLFVKNWKVSFDYPSDFSFLLSAYAILQNLIYLPPIFVLPSEFFPDEVGIFVMVVWFHDCRIGVVGVGLEVKFLAILLIVSHLTKNFQPPNPTPRKETLKKICRRCFDLRIRHNRLTQLLSKNSLLFCNII